eukprot:3522961-Alexandrium_andersonii.AAC.1
MSASLVGSEMCIRDRAAAPSGWISGPRSHFARGLGDCIGAPTCDSETLDCLLYTSDAADDM